MRKRRLRFWSIGVLLLVLVLSACHSGDRRKTGQQKGDSLFHSELLRSVTDSITQYPDSSRLYFERGGILYVMKEYQLAGKDLQKAISLDPLKTDYYISLGEIALAAGEFPAAEEAYRSALRLDSGNLMARLQLAFVLVQQKRFPQALAETDSLLTQDDKVVQAYGIKAQVLEALKDTAAALTFLKKAVSLAPSDYDALMATGDLLFNRHDTAALGYYRRAAEADTTQGEPLYCIGVFQQRMGKTWEAIAAYKGCVARDAYYLKAYLSMGGILEDQNDWEDALKVYTLATRIDPTSSEAFYHRGLCREKLKNLRAAKSDYQDALDLKSSNQEARAALDRLNGSDTLKPK